jgi:energy-coupling factor transport system ATP-binding protein
MSLALNAGALYVARADAPLQYRIDELLLSSGQMGLLIWDHYGGRRALLRFLLDPTSREIDGWKIDGEIVSSPGDPASGNTILLLRDPESQMSGCFETTSLEFCLPLALNGCDKTDQETAAGFWLHVWGLSHVAQAHVAELSTGQKQRLLVASCVASGPKLLLIDGPLEFIDPRARPQFLHLLKHVSRARRTAVLVAAAGDTQMPSDLFDRIIRVRGLTGVSRPTNPHRRASTVGRWVEAGPASISVTDLDYVVPGGTQRLYLGMSLRVTRGSGIVVVGRNGCGKSTLGHLLGGRLSPSRGRIEISGRPAQSWFSERTPQITCAFTDPDLTITRTTVWDELQGSAIGRLDDQTVREILALLELDRVVDMHPLDLDWQIRRRLALAKALRAASTAVFIDEPISDATADERFRFVEILRLCCRKGLSIVVATNDDALARSLGFEVIEIPEPRLECAPPRLESPLSLARGSVTPTEDRWEFAAWRARVSSWFEHAPEFSVFWAESVYPYLIPRLAAIGMPSDFVLVDLGCGHGLHTMSVAAHLGITGRPPKETIGIDAVPGMIDVARRIFSSGTASQFIVGDLTESSAIESLVDRLRRLRLPILFTALFSLHDMSSFEGLRRLFVDTSTLGSAFAGVIVSPRVAEAANGRLQFGGYETNNGGDWLWRGLFPVSVDRNRPLNVPYFHRDLSEYRALLLARWSPNNIITTVSPSAYAGKAEEVPALSRSDQVVFISATFQPGGSPLSQMSPTASRAGSRPSS